MNHSQRNDSQFSDCHELVKTLYLWRNGVCHRIEIVERAAKPGERASYVALMWTEEQHGAGHRILVRDVTFPWVHHESAESALDHAIGFLEARWNPRRDLEAEPQST